MDKYSYLSNGDVNAIETLYEQYKKDPESVDEGWQKFFQGFEFSKEDYSQDAASCDWLNDEFKVINLINAYRTRGHLFTRTNPVRTRRKYEPTLAIENFELKESDLDREFEAGSELGIGRSKLRDIISHLETTYCGSIGIEYTYIRKPEIQKWIRSQVETTKNIPNFSKEQKLEIFEKLNQASVFESFLHKKFVGQKRFSLEGGEALIPALDQIIENGADLGIKEFVLGMAHRGRLNVLTNIFNKTYEDVFTEFEGKEYEDNLFDGDVKYHLGYSADQKTNRGKDVHVTISPNPSHLEAVDPVVNGITRAKIDNYLHSEDAILPIQIHGDAAIAGQGVVYEVVQMAQLDGYRNGGTIHIVVNNQVGFTTNYIDARSSTYCTDVGKVTLSPVLHVNGDDIEAVALAANFCLEFRQKYKKDVFLDLLCYRKYGHNEGDEPRFTQPKLYDIIAKHPNPREIYLEQLFKEGVVDEAEAKKMQKDFQAMLSERLEESKQVEKATITNFLEHTWEGTRSSTEKDFDKSPKTAITKKVATELFDKMLTLPEDKKFFRKVQKLFNDRKKFVKEDRLDWALAETLAYASILHEGNDVRISGQDVERGTFSHRHAVLTLEEADGEYTPLKHLSDKQGDFHIYNSLLSEYGVLGFEYGYALASPNSLVIWEAQFGDFNNGAQIMIDQFISAAEDKWAVMNGLVMLLPHGYEGQGSEHSSARLERYLQLCAEDNIQIANCTTPANFFHLLRRQLARPFRKPLIVFTPKSLLRHPKCVSTLNDITTGGFNELLEYENNKAANKKLVFCSGKVYYDLLAKMEEKKVDNVNIVRVEQLYPFPEKQVKAMLKKYSKSERVIWLQEEPENMGAWSFIMQQAVAKDWTLSSIPASASPATGSSVRHEIRHNAMLNSVFEL